MSDLHTAVRAGNSDAPTSVAERLDNARWMFDVFAFLLALGVLFHQAYLSDWRVFSHHMVVSLAAIAVLARPSSVNRLAVLAASQIVASAIDLPNLRNHWLLLMLICGVLLHSAWLVKRRSADSSVDRGEWFLAFAPAVRVMLITTYAFAAFAKLNVGFFNPELSSAVALYGRMAGYLPFLPDGEWTRVPALLGTVAIEAAMPLLLIVRRTRMLGILLAASFHFAMAVTGFIPFSGLGMAFLFVFLPLEAARWTQSAAAKERLPVGLAYQAADAFRSRTGFVAMVTVWLGAAVVRTADLVPLPWMKLLTTRVAQASYATYAVLAIVILLLVIREGVRRGGFRAFRFPHPVLAALPVLLIFNGLSPYLGLKTESSFTMYSNLQTEGDQWNHLILPGAVRIFDTQDELITIVSSTDSVLMSDAERGLRWVPFELNRYLSDRPEVALTYRYKGEEITVDRVGDDPWLSKKPPLLLRKALWYRRVARPESNGLRH